MRALGMPFLFQTLTEDLVMSNISATSAVSPKASIIWVACEFMHTLSGKTNEWVKHN